MKNQLVSVGVLGVSALVLAGLGGAGCSSRFASCLELRTCGEDGGQGGMVDGQGGAPTGGSQAGRGGASGATGGGAGSGSVDGGTGGTSGDGGGGSLGGSTSDGEGGLGGADDGGAPGGAGTGASAGTTSSGVGEGGQGADRGVGGQSGETNEGGSSGGSSGPKSCEGETILCGSSSCCATSLIAGGQFSRGRQTESCETCTAGCPATATCDASDQPEHVGHVSSYYLESYEVTVGRFRRYVEAFDGPPEAGSGANPQVPGSGWMAAWNSELPDSEDELRGSLDCHDFATWTETPGDHETRPINCVSWFEAFAFCAWDGGRLPTEAEWEYAAAGGGNNRLYPWGSELPTDEHSNIRCAGDGMQGCSVEDILSVGSKPAGIGRWGTHDLGGSVFEYTLDVYGPYSATTCNNCARLDGGLDRVIRGGSWYNGTNADGFVRATHRVTSLPSQRFFNLGFRCAH